MKKRKPKEIKYKPPDNLTCYDCKLTEECPYAYDPYNTDGDCLMSK